MFLRGNLRVLHKIFIPLTIIFSILMFTDILAINPADDEIFPDWQEEWNGDFYPDYYGGYGYDFDYEDEDFDPYYRHIEEEEFEGEFMPDWMMQDIPSWVLDSVPRWFRSNAGGMELEEIPSSIAALRNKHALVIDYMIPAGLEPLLLPFYNSNYLIEIRVLYKEREEVRRQWRFLDVNGLTRLNAVIRYSEQEDEIIEYTEELPDEEDESFEYTEELPDEEDESFDDTEELSVVFDEPLIELEENEQTSVPQTAVVITIKRDPIPVGFIEIFNEQLYIISEYIFLEDGNEMQIHYYYSENLLIRAETSMKNRDNEYGFFERIYTDYFRYNRSYALRNIERLFHETAHVDPILRIFPYRVLDAAADMQFLIDSTPVMSDFFGGHSVLDGFRIVYDTDARGRVLMQTMLDDEGEILWTVTNTWSDDRIIAVSRIEGDDVKITEYEYNSDGDRIVQRDINNGELERIVRTDGNRDFEELLLNGIVVLRAIWEDGIKISEERVRR